MLRSGSISPRLFVGGLLAVLVIGLIWALNPSGRPESEIAVGETPSPGASPDAGLTPPPVASEGASEPSPSEAEILASALPPQRTTVQLLDAGGGPDRMQSVRSAMEQLGYQVVATASSRRNVDRTTIWFTSGKSNEAQALRVRDGRFAVVAPNQGLAAGVDLHVLVGADWG